MSENIITIVDKNDNIKKYKILLIIEKEYYYVIYTDLNNYNIKNNLYVVKLPSLDSKQNIPISEEEWLMIEKEYQKVL